MYIVAYALPFYPGEGFAMFDTLVKARAYKAQLAAVGGAIDPTIYKQLKGE